MNKYQINEKNKNLLLKYQINNTENIIKILLNNKSCLDGSDTGTGKSYCAVCAVATLKLRPIIICPLSIISMWKNVCNIFNVEPFFVVNYETIKHCKYYDKDMNRHNCPYITFNEDTQKYFWNNLPDDVVFIFDEVHKCSNIDTFNGKLLIASKDCSKNPLLILSATICDREEKFKIFFYILNFLENNENNIPCGKYIKLVENWVNKSSNVLLRIHNVLFQQRLPKATRMSIDILGDMFPKNQILVEPFL
jgi:hypothetical protein